MIAFRSAKLESLWSSGEADPDLYFLTLSKKSLIECLVAKQMSGISSFYYSYYSSVMKYHYFSPDSFNF